MTERPGINELYERIGKTIRSEEGRSAEALFQRKTNDILFFGDEPMPVLFYPYLLDTGRYRYVKDVSERMLALAEKAVDLFINDAEFRAFYGTDPFLLRLIDKDPGFRRNIPGARFDSYFDGKSLKFIELNAEGVACMEWNHTLNRIFADLYPGDELKRTKLIPQNLMRGVLDSLLECHSEFSPDFGGKPSIAIVDWRDAKTYTEFEAFRDYFISLGHDCVIAEPTELEYDGRQLFSAGMKTDIVYRRLLTVEYIHRYDECPALGDAYLDGKVCVSHPFRSYVGFNKKLFAYLWSEGAKMHFTGEELSLVYRHIPWTFPLEDGKVRYEGEEYDLAELVTGRKDRFVLKPTERYDGAGVVMGDLAGRSEWNEKVENELNGDYLVQERIDPPEFVLPDGTKLARHLGEYIFGGKLIGFMTRAGKSDLINESNMAMKIPTFVIDRE